jgi:hypothetical protein
MGWAKTENKFASLISFVTCKTPSTPATTSSRPVSGICSAAPAARTAKRQARGRHPENLCRPPRSPARRAHGAPANPCGGRQTAARDQENPSASVRLRHQPRHSGHQQWLRTSAAPLRHFTQNHQWLPRRMGRASLRRYSLSNRNARRRAIRAIAAIRLTLAGKPLPVAA